MYHCDSTGMKNLHRAMQEQLIFHPKHGPPPSEKARREYLSVHNTSGPYYGFSGNAKALDRLQRIDFAALAKYNHATTEMHFAFVGPDTSELTDLVYRHNRARQLPLAQLDPSNVKSCHDVFVQVSRAALLAGLPLVDMLAQRHYRLPPMDICVSDVHEMPARVRQTLGNAIEHGKLETERRYILDCRNIHWLVTTPNEKALAMLHTIHLLKIVLS